MTELRDRKGPAWQAAWLVSDGTSVYVVGDAQRLESVTRPTKGQLAFAIIAMGEATRAVTRGLAERRAKPFDAKGRDGQVCRYAR